MKELISRAAHGLSYLKQRKSIRIFFPGAAAVAGELHGRKAVDAIQWFVLAGVGLKECMDMYNDLVDIASEELSRFGMNASCRAKDVLHIVERVAMAGIVGEHSQKLYGVAANCLEAKMESNTSDSQSENDITDDNDKEECGGIDYETII